MDSKFFSLYKPGVWLVACLLICAGCGSAIPPQEIVWQDPAVNLTWPEPPDAPKVRYLRSLTGPKDFRKAGQAQKAWRWLLGDDETDLQLLTPFAIAAHDGVVWVADSGARIFYRIDLSREKVEYFREFKGQLVTLPSGVAIDPVGNRVFLADAAADHIKVLDSKGQLIAQWRPTGGFLRPAGLAVSAQGELFACDAVAGKVYVFDAQGQVVATLQSQLNPDGKFLRPLSVSLGPSGEVVVLDALAFRVEVLSRQGALLAEIGKPGDAAGSFARPKGVAVDTQGHIFVSDSAFDNIQVFDLAGNLLMYFGKAGSQPGQFSLLSGLFADGQGRLFAADTYNHRVQVFALLYTSQQ